MPDTRPFVFRHEDCGTETAVSPELMALLAADPYYFRAGYTTCSLCGEVPERQCGWTASGERLDQTMARLKAAKGTAYHAVRYGIWLAFSIAGAVALALFVPEDESWGTPLDAGFGALTGFFVSAIVGKWLRWPLCQRGI